jgi:hypothetical protein
MSGTATTTTFPFPHATLTPIVGKPTEPTVKLLQRELYTNARSVPSTRGGGANGYLGLLMPALAYAERAGALSPWRNVIHPGRLPIHNLDATSIQITARDRAYDAQLREYAELTKIKIELKQQILAAVPSMYLRILSDQDFGFADVSPAQLLTHLRLTYSAVEPEDLEKNRQVLKEPWNVDEPMELLWERLSDVRQFAARHGDAISEFNAMNLTLTAIEATGVFTDACDKWRDRETFSKNVDTFQLFFNKENKNRLRKLTAKQGGFHGANAAIIPPSGPPSKPPPEKPPPAKPPPGAVVVGETKMFYCWSHGLGWNPEHTSAKCSRKTDGHKDTATVNKMQGGCNTIMSMRRKSPSE